jgi:addiction module RelE/StbE family toxin
MKYTVSLSKEATKELDRLDRKTEKRIQDRLEELAAAPYSHRLSNELVMSPGRRYSRVGNWRILYRVIDRQKVIDVSAVQHRSRVYKELKK